MATRYANGTATGAGDGSLGNPWTLAQAFSSPASGDLVYMLGTFAVTATIATSVAGVRYEGYAVTPGDGGYASITNGGGSGPRILIQHGGTSINNVDFGNTTRAAISSASSPANVQIHNVKIAGATGDTLASMDGNGPNAYFSRIVASNVTSSGSSTPVIRARVLSESFVDNGDTTIGQGSVIKDCIYRFGAASTNARLNQGDGPPWWIARTIFARVGGGQVSRLFLGSSSNMTLSTSCLIEDCILCNVAEIVTDIGGAPASLPNIRLRRCALYNVTSTARVVVEPSCVTLTADPFTDAAGGDFRLNDVAGGGALLKAMQFAMPGLASTIVKPWLSLAQSAGGGTSGPRLPTGQIGRGR